MKIASVDIFKADLPLREPFRIAVMELRHAANVFIRINTDAGPCGWGESSPFWKLAGETQAIDLAAATDLSRAIKGKDPLELEDRLADIEGFLTNNAQIRSAFDMALHDLLGKSANMPLYRLLGGTNRPIITCITIPIGTAEGMAGRAGKLRQQGFSIIKIKLGSGPAEDIARVIAIRRAVGESTTLRVDANQGWDAPAAMKILNAIAPLNIEYCEQPVPYWNHAALAQIHARSPIPIVADETVFDHHDAFKAASLNVCDYINIKIAKAGGIRNAGKVAAIADAAGKACMIGCMMESRLGLSAGAHFALSQKHIRFFDLDAALLLSADPIIGGMRYDGEKVLVDEKLGLGVEVDEKYLAGLDRVTV